MYNTPPQFYQIRLYDSSHYDVIASKFVNIVYPNQLVSLKKADL